MTQLLLVALGGFAAGMVDGALGMGFGPTSSTILLSAGVSPIATSATVNIAKVATGFVAAIAHWRMGNIDRRLVARMAVSGMLGAVVGTSVLVAVDGDSIRPFLAAVLVIVGIRLLFRFARPSYRRGEAADADGCDPAVAASPALRIAAFGGGVTNGMVGAWGPVVTPFLLHRRVPPRIVVGSVNTAEVAVAIVSVGSLMGQFGQSGVEVPVLLAFLGGGVAAAPLAAHAVRFVPARLLGLAMACLLLITQIPVVLSYAGIGFDAVVFGLLVAVGVGGVGYLGVRRLLRSREAASIAASARQPRIGIVDQGTHVIGEVPCHEGLESDRFHDGPERGA